MESPASWSLITASLAVCDLTQVNSTWAFLVVQGLVRDAAGDRDSFAAFVRDEQARGEITGPSLPSRVASHLVVAGIARPAGEVPDPGGDLAAQRMSVITGWRRGDAPGMPVSSRESTRQNPWWKWC